MFVKKTVRIAILVAMLGVVPLVSARQAQKPLTNEGVIKMVKAKLSESVVVAAIQSSPASFDISPDGLIALQKAGVTQKEMDAVVAAQKAANGGGTATAAANADAGGASPAPAAAPGPKWQMPTVTVIQKNGSQVLPLEKTQLAETKTKPRSLASLSGDSAAVQGIQAGVNDATWNTATHINNGVGGSAVMQAGGIFNGILGSRQPEVTYVWGVPGPVSANVLQTSTPTFSVNFAKAPGVNPEEFAPEIVKLTPAQNICRLVGATRGREDARSHDAADWKIYSSFVEDRVGANLQKTAAGEYQMSPHSPLLPGEYAVVLRPVSRSEKVSGGDVARGQGPGLMFDTAWSFQVPDNAQ